MRKELQIPIAYDFKSGELFNVSAELCSKDLIYLAQRLYNTDNWDEEEWIIKERFFPKFNVKELCCYECDQFLELAVSANSRAFLRHKSGSNECDFKNSTSKENQLIRKTYLSKESLEHFNLKHKFGEALKATKDVSSIIVDSKFLFSAWGKRKPDVLCEFKDVVFVFEFQITDISLRYVISRSKFYKKTKYNNKPIFLIWMLNERNIQDVKNEIDGKSKLLQSSLAKRIKYLGKHQNFFSYTNLSHEYVKLTCHFKKAFVHTSTIDIHAKWTECLVELPSLKLDYDNREAYIYHFEKEKEALTPSVNLLKEERRRKMIIANQIYQESLKKEEELQKTQEALNEQFTKMRRTLLKATKLLDKLSFSVKAEMDKGVAQEDKISEISKINVAKIIENRESNHSPYYYVLGISRELYTFIEELLVEYNLYQLRQKILEFKNRPQYVKAQKKLDFIKKLKTLEENNRIFYEVNNTDSSDLFHKEQYARKLYYYERKDREYLFGITIKPKSYYDIGNNPEFIYLYEFTEELEEANDEVETIERIIKMATKNLSEQKEYLHNALIKSLDEYTLQQSDLKKKSDERCEFLQELFWKYLDQFRNNIPSFFCRYYYVDNKLCTQNDSYSECICHGATEVDFCPYFEPILNYTLM